MSEKLQFAFERWVQSGIWMQFYPVWSRRILDVKGGARQAGKTGKKIGYGDGEDAGLFIRQ